LLGVAGALGLFEPDGLLLGVVDAVLPTLRLPLAEVDAAGDAVVVVLWLRDAELLGVRDALADGVRLAAGDCDGEGPAVLQAGPRGYGGNGCGVGTSEPMHRGSGCPSCYTGCPRQGSARQHAAATHGDADGVAGAVAAGAYRCPGAHITAGSGHRIAPVYPGTVRSVPAVAAVHATVVLAPPPPPCGSVMVRLVGDVQVMA
jgi:hypothetical protein